MGQLAAAALAAINVNMPATKAKQLPADTSPPEERRQQNR